MNTAFMPYSHYAHTKQYTKSLNAKYAVKAEILIITMMTITFRDLVKNFSEPGQMSGELMS